MNYFRGKPRNKREQKVSYWARREERERILELLNDRYEDLMSCTKNDDCKEMARIIKVCMEDINVSV
jgi:hypothetical protein